MSDMPPIGVKLSADVEYREGRKLPYKARVRWIDPVSKLRKSKSEHVATAEAAKLWIDEMKRAAESGVDPDAATKKLADYGHAVMDLRSAALRRKRKTRTSPDGERGSCPLWGISQYVWSLMGLWIVPCTVGLLMNAASRLSRTRSPFSCE